MNVAARTAAGHRRRPATVLPFTERHQQPAATHAGPARTGTGYSLLAVVPVDASTTLAIVGHLLHTPRPDSPPPPTPAPSGLVVDRESREARVDATRIDLTFQEFELLDFFVSYPGRRGPRGQVWPLLPLLVHRRLADLLDRGLQPGVELLVGLTLG